MNFKKTHTNIMVFASIAVMISMVGCSAYKELVSNKNIAVERINSISAKITRAGLYSTDTNKIILRGELKRRVSLRGKIPGHLHLELVNQNGKTFKEAKFSYIRKNRKSRISLFSIPIPIDPSLISVVRITHHDIESKMADSTKSPWQGINTGK